MTKYPFDFSVVLSVYNVEEFLREAVESLVHQVIGFSRIQLIMVDDGSTDGSAKICDEYAEKYPENVEVVHKGNGGVSSSKNTGLPLVKGKYVSFFDPDDTLSPDAFQKVFAFMEKHPEVDISCIPFYYFGNRTGSHPLNTKFRQGTRVIDLSKDENADMILLSSATSFYRCKAAEKLCFDTELYAAEDAKENLRLLMDNPRLGAIADTRYNYRKHGNSILDKTTVTPSWYLTHLQHFSNWALDEAERKFGYIPKFVQHTVMYDLQWKLKQQDVPEGVLNDREKKEYVKLLFSTVCRIDDDVILYQKSIGDDLKLLLLGKKYETAAQLRPCSPDGSLQDLELCFGEKAVSRCSEMETVLDFICIDREKQLCTLEGYHILMGIKGLDAVPYLLIDGKKHVCTVIDRSRESGEIYGEKINEIVGFTGTFPVAEHPLEIRTALKINGVFVQRNSLSAGPFFPVCSTYRNSYCLKQNYMISMEKTHLSITKKPLLPARFMRECRFLAEIWRKNLLGGRKAVAGRVYYHLLKPFKRKQLWIISDRIMKADDNGEALFLYLQENPPKNTRIVFAVSKKSPDHERMSKAGLCVDAMSFRHKLLHLLCDVNISSQADEVTVNPYSRHCDALRDLLTHQRFVFLQHGITKDDISEWLNRYKMNISGIVTAAYREHDSIVSGDYGYSAESIWLTGFPRYDRLYHKEENIVTVMPTWRRYLMGELDCNAGKWTVNEAFQKSDYFRFYNRLLNSEDLLSFLEKHGYRLCFFPHPNIQPELNWFQHDPRVEFLPVDTSYREVYAKSRLVVTDYSSAVFDFAYLRKPVLYCQFDKEAFFSGQHMYKKGYFDYEQDGFGEVAFDFDTLIKLIAEYVENNCALKEEFRTRIDSFFAFNDRNNCKRTVEKIKAWDQ